MYANTRFQTEVDEWGRVKKEILPGDKVSQKDLDVSDDVWQNLIDRGLVVEKYGEDDDDEEKAEPAKAPEPPKPQAQAPQTSPAPTQSEQK